MLPIFQNSVVSQTGSAGGLGPLEDQDDLCKDHLKRRRNRGAHVSDCMTEDRISINRAPVLTLWAAVVAERLGFDREEALSLGKAVAGLTAQSKGRRLGIFAPTPEALKKARKEKRAKELGIEILGRHVPAINTPDGIRAVNKAKLVDPGGVERYLEGKFGEALPVVREAMRALAKG